MRDKYQKNETSEQQQQQQQQSNGQQQRRPAATRRPTAPASSIKTATSRTQAANKSTNQHQPSATRWSEAETRRSAVAAAAVATSSSGRNQPQPQQQQQLATLQQTAGNQTAAASCHHRLQQQRPIDQQQPRVNLHSHSLNHLQQQVSAAVQLEPHQDQHQYQQQHHHHHHQYQQQHHNQYQQQQQQYHNHSQQQQEQQQEQQQQQQQPMATLNHQQRSQMQPLHQPSATINPTKKKLPANGKKTKGRVRIKMEFIHNKLRRYTTFSKRKTGIMKKAFELATLTGTQVMLLVASETSHVYTFATRKLQPMIMSDAGKALIQTCLNSPDSDNLASISAASTSDSSGQEGGQTHQQQQQQQNGVVNQTAQTLVANNHPTASLSSSNSSTSSSLLDDQDFLFESTLQTSSETPFGVTFQTNQQLPNSHLQSQVESNEFEIDTLAATIDKDFYNEDLLGSLDNN